MNRGGVAELMGSAIRSTDRRFPDAAFGPYPPNDQKEVSQHIRKDEQTGADIRATG